MKHTFPQRETYRELQIKNKRISNLFSSIVTSNMAKLYLEKEYLEIMIAYADRIKNY